jgi:hypothetical protein
MLSTQDEREAALQNFRLGATQILITTDASDICSNDSVGYVHVHALPSQTTHTLTNTHITQTHAHSHIYCEKLRRN